MDAETSLENSQIRATLHPTGERHEQRCKESRSEGGRCRMCVCMYIGGWVYGWRVNGDGCKVEGGTKGTRERDRVGTEKKIYFFFCICCF